MNKFSLLALLFPIVACGSFVQPSNGCPTGDLDCGAACYDPNHYACENGKIVLTSCDSGYELCSGACVPFPSTCCPNGGYCFEQMCTYDNRCIPLGSEYCGGNRFCPFGHVCLNGGSSCSN
jgi:hypothetical protein